MLGLLLVLTDDQELSQSTEMRGERGIEIETECPRPPMVGYERPVDLMARPTRGLKTVNNVWCKALGFVNGFGSLGSKRGGTRWASPFGELLGVVFGSPRVVVKVGS